MAVCIGVSSLKLSKKFGIDLSNYIKPEPSGFWYKGRFYSGKYHILQVIPHPCDVTKSILLINCGDETRISKCLFTRKVIIPFMFNGINEYWNNEALILYCDSVYRIYEWGNDLEVI